MYSKNNCIAQEFNWTVPIFVLGSLCFIGIRFYQFQSTGEVLIWFDTATYVSISTENIWSRDFWFGRQPPLYPYFLKFFTLPDTPLTQPGCCQPGLLGLEFNPIWSSPLMPEHLFKFVYEKYNIAAISSVQWFISVLSWVVFTTCIYKNLSHSVLKVAGPLVLYLLAIEKSVVIWDRNIITESLSLSLFLTICTLLLMGVKNQSRAIFILLLVLMTFYINLRVTHIYFALFVMFWLGFLFIQRKQWQRLSLLLSIIIALFMFNQHTLFEAERSITPIRSIVSSRIMSPGYEEIREYFRNKGMPPVPAAVVGKFWYAPYSDYPELDKWLHQDASRLYQYFLLTHPIYFFTKPFESHNHYNESLFEIFVPNLDWQTPKNHIGTKILFTNNVVWVFLLIPSIVIYRKYKKQKVVQNINLTVFSVFLIGTGSLLCVISWHGDLVEVNRHVLPAMVQVRLGLLLLVLGLFDTDSLLALKQKK